MLRPGVVLLFTVVALLTHIPGFTRPFWNPDEGFLYTQAKVLDSGGHLYQQIVDRKPPILPFLYAGALRIAGSDTIWFIRSLAVVVHVITALLIAELARRRFGKLAVTAGILYLCASAGLAPEDAQAASFEVFMLPWTVGAVLLADAGWFASAGIATAFGALTKQTAATTLLPVLWRGWRYGGGAKRHLPGSRRVLISIALGFLIPIMIAALIFEWHDFFYWVVTGNGDYLSLSGAWGEAAQRGFGNLGIVAAASLGVVLAIGYGLRKERVRRPDADLWLWLLSSFAGVVAGFHFFGHYYLQVLPPLVLLGVGVLARHGERFVRYVVGYALVAATVFVVLALHLPTQPQERTFQIGVAIQERTRSNDKVLVWGMNPEIYVMADRKPASKYITAGLVTDFAGGRPADDVGAQYVDPKIWADFINELQTAPPSLIVDDSQGAAYAPQYTPILFYILQYHYHAVATVKGAVFYEPNKS